MEELGLQRRCRQQRGRRQRVLVVEFGQWEPRQRDKMEPEAEPETKYPKKKSLRIWEPFCFPQLFVSLS